MKKFALLSSLALTAAAAPLMGQTILFEDDFSSTGLGTSADNWNIYRNSPFSETRLVEITDANSEAIFGEANNNYMRIYKADSTTGSVWVANTTMPAVTSVITVEFDFVMSARDGVFTGNPDPRIRFGKNGDPIASNNNRVPGEVHFAVGGEGAVSGHADVYTPGEHHRMRVVYNHSSSDVTYGGRTLASSAYHIWVDGQFKFAVGETDDDRLTPNATTPLDTPLQSIAIGAFTGTAGELFLDNLVVYEGAIPEPSTYALGAGLLALAGAFVWRRRNARS